MDPLPHSNKGTDEPEDQGPGLGLGIRAGGVWMGASFGVQAVAGIGAQILLGFWLSPFDFGVFALFISTVFVFDILAVGGIRTSLTRQARDSIDRSAPVALQASFLLAVTVAIFLVVLSPLVARLFSEPALVPALVFGAVALPLRSYSTVAIPVLQARLEFRTIAIAMSVSTFVRYGVAVGLAAIGWGSMALVVGIVAGVAVLSASLVPTTISAARPRGFQWRPVVGFLRLSRWALSGDVAAGGAIRADYFVLGFFVPTAVLGAYYFAFQLVARVADLMLSISRNVLFPALAQLGGDKFRQVRGIRAAGAAFAIGGGVGTAALIANLPWIEQLIWGGIWASVMPAAVILAMVLPIQIALTSPEQLLKARGLFKKWTVVLLARAGGAAAVALGLGIFTPGELTPTVIAVAMAAFLLVEALVEMGVLSRVLSYPLIKYWQVVLPLGVWFVLTGWLGRVAGNQALENPLESVILASVVVALGSATAAVFSRRAGWFRSDSPREPESLGEYSS